MLKNKKILLCITGSIAAYKACALVALLKKQGCAIEIIMSQSALKFIGAQTLEGLNEQAIHHSDLPPGQVMKHIHLSRWCDIALLYPATANSINRMAHGLGDSLWEQVFLAFPLKTTPLWLYPAMNTHMWNNPITQRSLKILRSANIHIAPSEIGLLACGETGYGKLLAPECVLEDLNTHFQPQRGAHLQPKGKPEILITYGGTKEPIDGARSITNTSTGRTGAELCQLFLQRGYSVTALKAQQAPTPHLTENFTQRSFLSTKDLQNLLDTCLQANSYKAIIHLAAVSDYTVSEAFSDGNKIPAGRQCKIPSNYNNLTITLKRTPKLINHIKKKSKNPQTVLFGFKLTNSSDPQQHLSAIHKLMQHSHCDVVIHNDLNNINEGLHHFQIYENNPHTTVQKARSTKELFTIMDKILNPHTNPSQEVNL